MKDWALAVMQLTWIIEIGIIVFMKIFGDRNPTTFDVICNLNLLILIVYNELKEKK